MADSRGEKRWSISHLLLQWIQERMRDLALECIWLLVYIILLLESQQMLLTAEGGKFSPSAIARE